MIYDIIGDIHGHYDKLIGLLDTLGYQKIDGIFCPPKGHQAIFVGDLIDRGTKQVATLKLIFAMIDKGYAQAVMGNHEYNAIAYATYHHGNYLRPHTTKNTAQHQAFLDELPLGSPMHQYWLSRLYELPLWLELDDFWVIHACFDNTSMARLRPFLNDNLCLTPNSFLTTAYQPDTAHALERILKGIDVHLPTPYFLLDGSGNTRQDVRICWWQDDLTLPILQICAASNCNLSRIPDDLVVAVDFDLPLDKPVFIGHYWLKNTPKPLSDKVVCVDYSAGGTGFLTAYRFDTANPLLSADNFIQYRPKYLPK